MKKAQIWSLELSITIAMFLIALVLFGAIILKHVPESETLLGDAENVMSFLTSGSEQSFIMKGNVNKSLAFIFNYSILKKQANINEKACIYFENKKGKVISLNGTEGVFPIYGLGDSSILINGVPCLNNT